MIINKSVEWFSKATLFPFYRSKYRSFLSTHDQSSSRSEIALIKHIGDHSGTAFGRDHGLRNVASLKAFRQSVPISTHGDLRPYLDAVAAGDTGALFPNGEEVLAFGCTTGTTGTPKILPLTKSWLKTYQRHSQIWGVKAIMDHPGIMTKRWLQITGPLTVSRTASGHDVGMLSGVTIQYQHPIFKLFYATPPSLSDIQDTDARNYAMLRLAVPESVGFIVTITPSNLIQLAEVSDTFKQDLIRDIHDGTTTGPMTGYAWPSPDLEARGRLRNPKRAAALEHIVAETGTLYPKDYWDLELVSCWTGGTVGYQAQKLGTYFGTTPVRDLGYISTEGRHTIPVDDFSANGVLVADGAYYEFETLGSGAGDVLSAHELTIGQSYSVILTNGQGLWRYRIGDIVRCTGYQGQSPVLTFLHKTDQVSDMEGEKISADHLISAVTTARQTLSLPTMTFSCVPTRSVNGLPYYDFLFEPSGPRDPVFQSKLIDEIDRNLCALNLMYRQKRASKALSAPQITLIAPGTWARLAKTLGAARGTGETQYKQPILMNQDVLSRIDSRRRTAMAS
jgi:GH3 auxin-responsive promoter